MKDEVTHVRSSPGLVRLIRREPRKVLGLALLALAGIAGNHFRIPFFFGVDFLFGSVAVLLAVRVYGVLWGTAVAAVASSYTVLLWGHPYALLIFTVEAAFVGLAGRRGRGSIFVLDGVYWLVLGMPLVWLFYGRALGLDDTSTVLIALKQSMNGVFNALVASLIYRHTPLVRWIDSRASVRTASLYETFAGLAVASALVPALIFLVWNSRWEMHRLEEERERELYAATSNVAEHLDDWIGAHMHAVVTLAETVSSRELRPSDELQHETEIIKEAYPDLHNMYVADATATTVAFHPPVNEKGESTIGINFADRWYFQQLRATGRPVLSDVFEGRGGVFAPIVTLSAPVFQEGRFAGFALGALDLGHLANLLEPYEGAASLRISIVDRRRRILASTRPDFEPLEPFAHGPEGIAERIDSSTYRWIPADPDLSSMERWRDSIYVRQVRIGTDVPWTAIVEAPIAPLQAALYGTYIKGLAMMIGITVLVSLFAFLTSRWIVGPLRDLAGVTRFLPDDLLAPRVIDWPRSSTTEIEMLVQNFQSMTAALERSFRDLGERTEELARLNVELQAEMDSRKRLEATMRQRQKMEAIGTLAGGIAHDFNNILMGLLGYAELALDRSGSDPKGRRFVEEIIVAGNRARDLVRQILAFSRAHDDERRPTLLQPICRDAVKFIRASLPATIKIREDLEESAGAVRADPTQIYQVITNLCTNAKHAMRTTGGVLDVGLHPVHVESGTLVAGEPLEPGDYVRLTVRDDGEGMTADVRERAFEPFFTTKEVGEGTGMGLAVVHGIVTNHGGRVDVHSSPGRGSTMEIYLPLSGDPAAPIDRPDPAPLEGHERILFGDDEQSIGRFVKEALERLGYQIAVYDAGRDALGAFRKDPDAFDVVITDQTMPQMTGQALAREIRKIRSETRIILCTGYRPAISPESGEPGLLDATASKPLSATELSRLIRSVMQPR